MNQTASPASLSPQALDFREAMQLRTANLLQKLGQSAPYRSLFSPATPMAAVKEFVRNVLFETHSYGHHVTEAAFTGLGRLPKSKPQIIAGFSEQLIDEVFHPEIAGQDFIRLGGSATDHPVRLSPESFAVAATARTLATHESPFCYLGFIYLLENTTPILADRVQQLFASRQFDQIGRFIPLHAKEDIKHQQLIQEHTENLVTLFPEAAADIQWGFDCFAAVYPLPIWQCAFAKIFTPTT